MNFLSPFGEPCGQALIKTYPEDFQVTELPSYTPCGEGEHLWLWIKKIGANTAWVAEELAKQSGLKLRDISYAGRKDRQAVTEQWFSLYDPRRTADNVIFEITGCSILEKRRHKQKLRIGNLEGNRFVIRLRNFDGDLNEFRKRIELILVQGFPNYFGQQRFGRDQANLGKAIRWIEQGGGKLRRDQRSLYFSVLRSYLFNLVLSQRVQEQSWNQILSGELAQLAGSHSLIIVDENQTTVAEFQERCDDFDLHPTGPLYGKGELHPAADALRTEHIILKQYGHITEFLNNHTNSARRSLRVKPSELDFQRDSDDLVLSFSLPAGSYASVLLGFLIYTDLENGR